MTDTEPDVDPDDQSGAGEPSPSSTDDVASTASTAETDAEATTEDASSGAEQEVSVAQGTYQLLRGRLETAAQDLADRSLALNNARLEAFGSSQLDLAATERVRTENNVVPRDVAAVDEQLIMAYNAQAGIRSEIRPEDVFSVHHLEEVNGEVVISPNPDGLAGSALDDDTFRRDFQELHAYFKDARVQQVYRSGQKLLAVFRTGTASNDIRVLRWEIEPDGGLRYLDDRGDRDHRFPPSVDVDWFQTTRADHVDGRFIAVLDRVFVGPLGGKIEIRIEDGSPAGEQLLVETVAQSDQALQDCEVAYAQAGDLVLLRVLPYGETVTRYYIVNLLMNSAVRQDSLGTAFRQLPEGHGLIFPDGIYFRTGEVRTFDLDPSGMELLEVVHSPNGEDVLYVFHQIEDGRSILLPYNVVRQEITNPIWCHGHCTFADGGMVVFREEPEPTRVHPIQLWVTPFCSDEWYADQPRQHTSLDRIGNPALVSGIADSLALTRAVSDVEPSAAMYGDLLGSAGRTLDTHHWLGSDEVGDLAAKIKEIRLVAEQVIDEFERVQEVRKASAQALTEAEASLEEVAERRKIAPPQNTEQFIGQLGDYRSCIGHLHTLRARREINLERIDELVAEAQEGHDRLAQEAARHLSSEGAFTPYHKSLETLADSSTKVNSSVAASKLMAEVDTIGEAMDMVAGTVGDLVVDDPRVRTSVLEQVSNVLAELNRVRAGVESKLESLIESETGAAFATELGLFGQSIATSLARADTPEACDDAMARLLLQLEQLETSAPRTDSQLEELEQRRDQVTEALSSRRQTLVDNRQQRADRLVSTGTRTLERVVERSNDLDSADEINGFFAADPMVVRVRSLVEQLRELGEPVRADELFARLGSARDGAIRALRDRQDLFDGDAVKLGVHRFSVDDRKRELTLVPAEDSLNAVLTGTDLRIKLDRPELNKYQELWDSPLPSENDKLYRSTFLAGDLLASLSPSEINDLLSAKPSGKDADDPVLELVRAAVDNRLDEGYDRGVHDLDAAAIMRAMGDKALIAGSLLTSGPDRAAAQLAWALRFEQKDRERWESRGAASAELTPDPEAIASLVTELAEELELSEAQARYLFAELSTGEPLLFTRTKQAEELTADVARHKEVKAALKALETDLDGASTVLTGFVHRAAERADQLHLVPEVTAALLTPDLGRSSIEVDLSFKVDGINGRHATIDSGTLAGRVDEVMSAVANHRASVVPQHNEFMAARREIVTEIRDSLRVDDLEPKVPEGFVRNQLIDKVYLPLIGDNLARQIGTVDDAGGARSGLLMLLSPPGYGKTTLVEYVADRLGMALVKISGPGLGHEVTSLDPEQAPSATSAREIERINLSFSLGSNVLLYLDDIQHTNPEFLQRFISLCDGQRRIEGVWDGAARTFDLRGKRFAVVMAGNPYTESGQRFRVPDMLANRADTYNLGDVLTGNDDLFARSFLENALTANKVTAPLSGRDPADFDRLVRAAEGHPLGESELSHSYSSAETNEIITVLQHLKQVQSVVLAVNRQYIASAASDDTYRTEPSFLLQGSYRNMVRMASRILPAMTHDEVETIIDEHYVAESQALTAAAEANLLKLAELRDKMTDSEQERWEEILTTFRRQKRLGGDERDPATRVVAAIESVGEALRQQSQKR